MKRSAGSRAVKGKVIAIACDGERTENDYFRNWKTVLGPSRLSIRNLTVRSGGNPLHAVKAAIKSAKRDPDFHDFWCVCDVDGSSADDVAEAVRLAAKNRIKLVLSDRCFELWIALHFERTSRVLTSEADAIALVRRHIGGYAERVKVAPFASLFPLTESACRNADWLKKQAIVGACTDVQVIVATFLEEASKASIKIA